MTTAVLQLSHLDPNRLSLSPESVPFLQTLKGGFEASLRITRPASHSGVCAFHRSKNGQKNCRVRPHSFLPTANRIAVSGASGDERSCFGTFKGTDRRYRLQTRRSLGSPAEPVEQPNYCLYQTAILVESILSHPRSVGNNQNKIKSRFLHATP